MPKAGAEATNNKNNADEPTPQQSGILDFTSSQPVIAHPLIFSHHAKEKTHTMPILSSSPLSGMPADMNSTFKVNRHTAIPGILHQMSQPSQLIHAWTSTTRVCWLYAVVAWLGHYIKLQETHQQMKQANVTASTMP